MGLKLLIITTIFIKSILTDKLPNTTECGIQVASNTEPRQNKIHGGNETYYGEFPWLAALHYRLKSTGANWGVRCSGSVISTKFVLTAAYCIHLTDYILNEVWLGVRKISQIETSDVNSARKFSIYRTTVHEDYNNITRAYDIALIQLSNEIKITTYIRPICLPDANAPVPPSGTFVMVAGWGQIQGGLMADHKLKVEVQVFKHDICEEMLGYQIRNNQICSRGGKTKDTCFGDEGGPVMLSLSKSLEPQWFALGVISLNFGCNFYLPDNRVSIHTRVSSFTPWIRKILELAE